MFTKKHDPVVDSVRQVMEQNDLRRRVTDALNEELGIVSRNALPHEQRAKYDAALEEAYKCAMKEAKDSSKDFHVISPDGKKTVMISNSQEDAQKSAETFGKGYKVYRGDKLPSTWEGSGTGSSLFSGKKKLDENEGSTPRNEKEANLAALKEPRNKITHADALKGRGVIKQEETQLEEKATESQKEKVAKVMHKWKQGKEHIGKSDKTVPQTEKGRKQAVAIALSQAGLSKKQKMDESLEAIKEEIRISLEEQLVTAYEATDPKVFENFVSSLTEEQIDILGLNEASIFGQNKAAIGPGMSNMGSSIKSGLSNIWDKISQSSARGYNKTEPAAKPSPAAGARAASEIAPGEGQKPAPAVQPTAATTPASVASRPTSAPAVQPTAATTPAPATPVAKPSPTTAATTPAPVASRPTPAPAVPKPTRNDSRPIAGFAPNVSSGQPGGSKWGNTFQESSHIRESLESVIRSRYLKG